MTVCIATLCNNGNDAIVMTDCMITSEGLAIEFEYESKIDKISNKCVVVTSGDASIHDDILRNVIEKYRNDQFPEIHKIVEDIKEEWSKLRIKIVEENLFKPRQLNIKEYYLNQSQFDESIIKMVEAYIDEELIDLYMLVVGVDKFGAHIYYIVDPGTSKSLTSLGFYSIGTGQVHAQNSLISNHFSKDLSLNKALYLTYEAKKLAQVAPGVGKNTNIVHINQKECIDVSEKTIDSLEEIFKIKEEIMVKSFKKIENSINQIKIITSERGVCT